MLTACNAAQPAKSKMAARGSKMADGVWKGVHTRAPDKFLDPSTPSMRKVDDGKKEKKKKKKKRKECSF